MKKFFTYCFLLPAIFLFSCSSPTHNYGEPIVKPDVILKDIMSFLVYRQKHIRFAEEFIALDSASTIIDKSRFLKQLATGNYLPLRLQSKDSVAYYQLHPITSSTNTDIQQTIIQWGEHLYSLHQMEGKELPDFDFVDLEGKVYNKQTTKDKIVVLKCWFIGCVPCVKEMPALNELVKQYSSRNDIVFVSLALDSAEQLRTFLKKTSFNYAVVPKQKSYLLKEINITQFPTHLIINKQGSIVKVVNEYKELATALHKEALK